METSCKFLLVLFDPWDECFKREVYASWSEAGRRITFFTLAGVKYKSFEKKDKMWEQKRYSWNELTKAHALSVV